MVYSQHTQQEPKCQKERNNQKYCTNCETNTRHTLEKNLFRPNHKLTSWEHFENDAARI